MVRQNRQKPTELNTLSQAAAARHVGVSRQAIQKAIADGRLRSVSIAGPSRGPRVLLTDLEAWKRRRDQAQRSGKSQD